MVNSKNMLFKDCDMKVNNPDNIYSPYSDPVNAYPEYVGDLPGSKGNLASGAHVEPGYRVTIYNQRCPYGIPPQSGEKLDLFGSTKCFIDNKNSALGGNWNDKANCWTITKIDAAQQEVRTIMGSLNGYYSPGSLADQIKTARANAENALNVPIQACGPDVQQAKNNIVTALYDLDRCGFPVTMTDKIQPSDITNYRYTYVKSIYDPIKKAYDCATDKLSKLNAAVGAFKVCSPPTAAPTVTITPAPAAVVATAPTVTLPTCASYSYMPAANSPVMSMVPLGDSYPLWYDGVTAPSEKTCSLEDCHKKCLSDSLCKFTKFDTDTGMCSIYNTASTVSTNPPPQGIRYDFKRR